jgi:hypothetical protein
MSVLLAAKSSHYFHKIAAPFKAINTVKNQISPHVLQVALTKPATSNFEKATTKNLPFLCASAVNK